MPDCARQGPFLEVQYLDSFIFVELLINRITKVERLSVTPDLSSYLDWSLVVSSKDSQLVGVGT